MIHAIKPMTEIKQCGKTQIPVVHYLVTSTVFTWLNAVVTISLSSKIDAATIQGRHLLYLSTYYMQQELIKSYGQGSV